MATRTTITWEQFLASALEGQKCEWVDGEVVQMSPVNLAHERVLALLIEYLVDYCRVHPDIRTDLFERVQQVRITRLAV